MKVLLINTSQPEATVALARDKEILAQRQWPRTPAIGGQLLVAINDLLHEHGWQLHNLDRIAVHTGPGATSALRQGAITAAMLAYTTGAQLVGVSGDDMTQLLDAAITGEPQTAIHPDYRRPAT